MRSFGLNLLAVIYVSLGGFIGEAIRRGFQGRATEVFAEPVIFGIALVLNLGAVFLLVRIHKSSRKDAALQSMGRPLDVFIRGLPVTSRISFLVLTASYGIGLIGFALFG